MTAVLDYIDPEGELLTEFKDLLNSEDLCFEDLDEVSVLRVKVGSDDRILAGFGLEIFGADALLRSVIVEKNNRGNGLGHEIIEYALKEAEISSVKNIYLLTTAAYNFFRKLGFQVIHRASVPMAIANTEEFKTFCPDTAVCMKFEL